MYIVGALSSLKLISIYIISKNSVFSRVLGIYVVFYCNVPLYILHKFCTLILFNVCIDLCNGTLYDMVTGKEKSQRERNSKTITIKTITIYKRSVQARSPCCSRNRFLRMQGQCRVYEYVPYLGKGLFRSVPDEFQSVTAWKLQGKLRTHEGMDQVHTL